MISYDYSATYRGNPMNQMKRVQSINEVHGEITRILLQYWEIMGRPELAEFMSLIPIEPALEYIERTGKKVNDLSNDTNLH